jgi:hypothetical protein
MVSPAVRPVPVDDNCVVGEAYPSIDQIAYCPAEFICKPIPYGVPDRPKRPSHRNLVASGSELTVHEIEKKAMTDSPRLPPNELRKLAIVPLAEE